MDFKNIFSTNNIQPPMILDESYDFDIVSNTMESLIVMEGTYRDIMITHATAVHIGIIDENSSILTEGFNDLRKSTSEFFKKMVENFRKLMNKFMMFIHSRIGTFEKFISKYKPEIEKATPDFMYKGFDYQLARAPKIDKIQAIIQSYNSELTTLEKMEVGDLIAERDQYTSESEMDKLRSYVANDSSQRIDSDDYSKTLKELYRSGTSQPEDIHVKQDLVRELLHGYSDLKVKYKEATKLKDSIIVLIESLTHFFEKSAPVHYNGTTKQITSHRIEMDKKGSRINVDREASSRINYDDNMLKKVNLFYNFKMVQSKELGAICMLAMVEYVTAIKEALVQSERIIRTAAFSKKEGSTD